MELNEFLKLKHCKNPSERHIFFNKHISHRYPVIFSFLSDKVFEKIAEDFMKNNKMQASGM